MHSSAATSRPPWSQPRLGLSRVVVSFHGDRTGYGSLLTLSEGTCSDPKTLTIKFSPTEKRVIPKVPSENC